MIMSPHRKPFRYRPPSVFQLLLRIAQYEMKSVDSFVELAKEDWTSRLTILKRRVAREAHTDDDRFVDDFAQLDEFAALSGEFAIVGLWRCVELYRKAAIQASSGPSAARQVFKNSEFRIRLSSLGISERTLRCARSVDELRCLNNAIKHDRYVRGELAAFSRWRAKSGEKLTNLEPHYPRLRVAAERYLADLARRLKRRVGARPLTSS